MREAVQRWQRDPGLRRALRLGALIGAWLGAALFAAYAIAIYTQPGHWFIGADAHAYWMTGHRPELYGPGPGEKDAFLYSPLFAQVIYPLTLLPWPAFCSLLMALDAIAILWLLRPLPLSWRVPLFLLTLPEVMQANVNGVVALTIAIGMARPAALGFPLLTKISPAVPGLVWFVVRREWWRLLKTALVIGVLVGASIALDAHAWQDWFQFLITHGGDAGWERVVRDALALVVAVWAARRNAVWLLPVACWLAIPMGVLHPNALVILAAIPRLVRYQRRPEPQHRDEPRPEIGSMANYST